MSIDISSVIPAVAVVLYVLFTVFGLYRVDFSAIHWSFILYMTLMSIWSFGSFMMHVNSNALTPLLWNRIMLIGMFGGPITIFHSMVRLLHRPRNYHFALLVVGYFIYGLLLVMDFAGLVVVQAGFTEAGVFSYRLGHGAPIAYSLSYIYLMLAIVVLIRELRRDIPAIDRTKLLLPLYGATIMLLGVLFNLYEPVGKYPVDIAAATVNAILIFYAIYRYRLVHYSVTVLRSMFLVVLTILSASLFYLVIWVAIPEARSASFAKLVAVSVLLALVAALVFQPFWRRFLRVLERLYLGEGFAYNQDLRSFSASLSTIVDLGTLGELTLDRIGGTFDLEWSFMVVLDYTARYYRITSARGLDLTDAARNDVVLRRSSAFIQMISRAPSVISSPAAHTDVMLDIGGVQMSFPATVVLPLRFKERVNGCLVIGRRRSREYFNQYELETLEILAAQCSIALENAISFERLRRQQKRLQALNREVTLSRNKLEAFFDGITTPISIQDINYNIVMVNMASTRYFRSSYKNLIGQKCYKAFFGKNKPCENCMAQDSLHTGLPFSVENTHLPTDTTFSMHFYPIKVPIGEVPAGSDRLFLEFFQDVTQQKRLQAELIQSEKLASIGTLASGIAHEINNPLGGILGTAELILDDAEKGSKVEEYATDIIQYSRNAADVISELTSYARKAKEETVSVKPSEAIESALKLAQRGLKLDRIEIRRDYDEVPAIDGSANELQQVLLNLIINAVQAMNGEGILTVTCKQIDWNVVIAVGDTGQGIPNENLQSIFTPFFTTKDPGDGTGLGLSISHRIVSRMGGRIHVNSEIGRGTTFTITIPLVDEDKYRIRFVNVSKPEELEDVFYIQRKILVGEKGYLEETIHRREDENAYHILAYKGLQPVGTVTCMTPEQTKRLPIEEHFGLRDFKDNKRCVEIDRLAVMKDERGSIVPLGLMTLAYLFAKSEGAERVFLDVFSDERKHIGMYRKLGFQVIGSYDAPLPVDVMMLDHQTYYEQKAREMEYFVKPFMSRLIKRIEFTADARARVLSAAEQITSATKV